MLEKINNCPICKNNLFEHHIECKDYMISGETFNITKCTNCSFLFTNPRPTPKDLGAYYESEEYISSSLGVGELSLADSNNSSGNSFNSSRLRPSKLSKGLALSP